jgi:hypothetical protein
VGVTDLREALSGRSSMSNPALAGRAPSVLTADRVSSILPELALRPVQSRKDGKRLVSGSNEVRDVLRNLGIGNNVNALLRSPSTKAHNQATSYAFPCTVSSVMINHVRRSTLVPPYNA